MSRKLIDINVYKIEHSKPRKAVEIYFEEHKRAVVVDTDGSTLISIDVYPQTIDIHSVENSVCVMNTMSISVKTTSLYRIVLKRECLDSYIAKCSQSLRDIIDYIELLALCTTTFEGLRCEVINTKAILKMSLDEVLKSLTIEDIYCLSSVYKVLTRPTS